MLRYRLVALALLTLAFGACADRATPLDPAPAADRRAAAAPLPVDGDITLAGVQLRPGVTVDLHLSVFANEERNSPVCAAKDVVFAVPGFAHTAATWEPYAEALFEARPQQVCAVVALDLPGHGESGLPEGAAFGELLLDDYATATLAALERIGGAGTLVAHSQGGLVVQMAQQRLVSAGSSLREAAGVAEVQLLAPAPASAVPWAFAETGVAAQVLTPLLVLNDPVLGPHASVPADFWPVLFFSNLSGQVVSGAPTAVEVSSNGYAAPAPLYASLQLIGAPPFARPSVDAAIFAGRYGTRLSVVAFEQDQLIRPEEARALLQHLLGGPTPRNFTLVTGRNAAHDLYLADPAAILRVARPRVP